MMKHKNVLVIDDAEDITFILKTVLEFNDFEVQTITDPQEALAELRRTSYDLVITDYVMDNLDGLELIEKIRADNLDKQPKIILLTFKDLTEKEVKTISKCETVYLKKPFSPDELIQKVDSILG